MSLLGRCLTATLAALLSCTAFATPARAAGRLDDGAVVVWVQGAHGPGVGSGTIVSVTGTRIRVITARHVATYGTLSIHFDDQGLAPVPARILSLIPGHDLAVIEADVAPALAATLRPATIGRPRTAEAVHVWGSGFGGPALESGAVASMPDELPDGPANGRYGLSCDTCHQGDSGGGVFDAQGELIGVYVGFWSLDSGKLGVVEPPGEAAKIALETPVANAVALAGDTNEEPPAYVPTSKIARSNTATTPAASSASTDVRSMTAVRTTASPSASSASASGSDRSSATVPDADSRAR
jgi:hypothetical protein